MKPVELDYNLPKELIAQYPLKERDSCRLLILNRETGGISHGKFNALRETIQPGDCLVLNNTRVMHARLFGRTKREGRDVEVLILRQTGENVFDVLTRPGRKIKEGDEIFFSEGVGQCFSLARARVLENGSVVKKIHLTHEGDFSDFLKETGRLPLPPYIKREPVPEDYEAYQTVYAEKEGAVAAPTAGLHFTAEILKDLREKGVRVVFLTLHVGYGSFQPLKSEDGKLYPEYFEIGDASSAEINRARREGRRVWAVGTTVCRALETSAQDGENGFEVKPATGWTGLFIKPPYRFKLIDGLITNFHLPGTSLLLLVSAFCGKELLLRAYNEAIKERYRFYSYGDAMLIS